MSGLVSYRALLRGIYTALVTPFDEEGRVDAVALQRVGEASVANGAVGLVALGTSGEAAMLTPEESHLVQMTCRRVADRTGVPLMVGVGTAGTQASIAQVRERQEYADFLLALVPYYVRPSDAGVISHFEQLADAAEKPIVLYNIPYRTGKTLELATLLHLLDLPGVVGLKQCVGTLDLDTLEILSKASHRAILTGDDAYVLPLAALGGAGGICVTANLLAAPLSEAVDPGTDRERAIALQEVLVPAVRALFAEPSPAVTKAVLHARGEIQSPAVRSPLAPASRHAVDEARQLVDAALAPG